MDGFQGNKFLVRRRNQKYQILQELFTLQVPAEFQAQHPTHANPPSMLLAISALLSRANSPSNPNFKMYLRFCTDSICSDEVCSFDNKK